MKNSKLETRNNFKIQKIKIQNKLDSRLRGNDMFCSFEFLKFGIVSTVRCPVEDFGFCASDLMNYDDDKKTKKMCGIYAG